MKKLAGLLAVLTGAGIAWAGCSQTPAPVFVQSLERSGRAAFVCIRDPASPTPGQQLDTCFTPGQTPNRYNYLGIPHLIALVTQTARGEVAVVDVTAGTVLDIDNTTPGYNFLPMPALPTDIVSTPGGNATFVGGGDATRPGIFAIPSSILPLVENAKPPTFASFPACALPPGGVPTEMVIVPDLTLAPSEPGGRRAHCDGSSAAPARTAGTDLTVETELFGRLKLAVTLPELGEIDIIDAQDLLSREPGSFDPCTVERRVFLTVDPDLPPALPPGTVDAGSDAMPPTDGPVSSDAGDASVDEDGAVADGAAADGNSTDAGSSGDAGSMEDVVGDGLSCSRRLNPSAPASLKPHPYALALSEDGRLFVSDDSASVIHVVDVSDPCAAAEKAPLLPVSAVDDRRAVVTGAIAVSPLTSDGKRFVYASDVKNNGSVMVFDVSAGSTNRRPLLRQDRVYNPFEPPDRIALAAPVEAITFATQEVPLAKPDPVTGVIPRGIPCDPTNADDPNRPQDDFVSGAAPRRLRGTFAFLVMSNGDMNVVDLDDYDQQCRRPRFTDDPALGCGTGITIPPTTGLPSASMENSCKVVERHRLRSMNYFTNEPRAGRHAPAMLNFPILYEKDGTSLIVDPSRPETFKLPKLLGPELVAEQHDPSSWPLLGTVLSSDVSPNRGLSSTPAPMQAQLNWVAFDLREPRAHATQSWNVTYEGTLPWFLGRRGRLQCAADKSAIDCETGDNPSHLELYDSSVGFCDGGAQGEDLALPGAAADIVEIIDNMPDAADPYWTTVADICSRQRCEESFGTRETPKVIDQPGNPIGRDIAIAKSYQGRLSLKPTVAAVPLACCFPYPVAYTIRAGHQWIVTGQATGFVHRLIPDPTAPDPSLAACIESCDPNLRLRNARLVSRSPTQPVPRYDDPDSFQNAQMRFVIWDMDEACANPPCAAGVRDRYFAFQEAGGFVPMRFVLSTTPSVLPQSVQFVRGIQKLAVPDPVSNGLMLFDLGRLRTTDIFN